MITNPYKAFWNNDHNPVVSGPGEGLGYYCGLLYPHLVFESKGAAEVGARVANIAYAVGYAHAQADIRKALGL